MSALSLLPWFAGVAAIIGFTLLWIGLRGRPLAHEPRCRRCGLGLAGLVPESDTPDWKACQDWKAKVCPECGSSLVLPRAVKRSSRRKRWGVNTLALVLLLAAAGLITPATAARIRAMNPAASAPTRAMALLIPSANSQQLNDMLGTLDSRRVNGDLSSGDIRALARAALKRQQDATKAWDPRLGNVIEEAFDRDLISVQEAIAYIKAGFRAEVHVYDQVLGGTLDVGLQCRFDQNMADYQHRSPRLRSIPIVVELEPVLVDKEPARDVANFSTRTISSFMPGLGWSDMRRIEVPSEEREVVVEAAYTIRIDETLWDSQLLKDESRAQAAERGNLHSSSEEELPPFRAADNAITWRETVSIPVTLTANTRVPVKPVHDEALALSAAKAFTVTVRPGRRMPDVECYVTVECDETTLPIALMGKMALAWNGREPTPIKRSDFYAPRKPQPGTSWQPPQRPDRFQFYTRAPQDWDQQPPRFVFLPDTTDINAAMHYLREAQRKHEDLRVLGDPVYVDSTLDQSNQPRPPGR